jgi:GT2 family glycosyltransferase
MTQASNPVIGAVAIGRNEGERLKRCLTSILSQNVPVVYVDSGSSDDSVAFAEANGVSVTRLDMSVPFTAARARNAGYADLIRAYPDLQFVQFVDGDCSLAPDWIEAARQALQTDEGLGIVTGWRSEIFPEASVYNAICDLEWHAPAGPIVACGGDMVVRRTAFEAAGGFNPQVIAAEDDEFSIRVGAAGFTLQRLPLEMTYHDADMHSFGQWWQRAVRAGHGYAQVGDMHPGYFAAPRKRVLLFGALLPLAALLFIVLLPLALWIVVFLYGVSYVKTAIGLRRSHPSLSLAQACHHAIFMLLSKFPNTVGFVRYYLRKLRKSDMEIIEYK